MTISYSYLYHIRQIRQTSGSCVIWMWGSSYISPTIARLLFASLYQVLSVSVVFPVKIIHKTTWCGYEDIIARCRTLSPCISSACGGDSNNARAKNTPLSRYYTVLRSTFIYTHYSLHQIKKCRCLSIYFYMLITRFSSLCALCRGFTYTPYFFYSKLC
jgi:hypothetical protein